MCIAFFVYRVVPELPLILAANRDELYRRPTRAMDFWEDRPRLLAGRDLEAGGTWLGLHRNGRLAFVTNYREPGQAKAGAPSRGGLVVDFLESPGPVEAFIERLKRDAPSYNGFNLVFGTPDRLFHFSNRGQDLLRLEPGYYGLSNGLLNTPWPKVTRGLKGLRAIPPVAPAWTHQVLFEILADRTGAPDEKLPSTGVDLAVERVLSPIFIQAGDYGTRCGTAVIIDRRGRVSVEERNYERVPERYERRFFDLKTERGLCGRM